MMITIFCPDTEPTEPVSAAGRPIFAAPECMDYARATFSDPASLNEMPLLRKPHDGGLFWRLGLTRAEESAREVRRRTAEAAETLLASGQDCVVAADPEILRFLLRALEKRRCVIRRARSGALMPGERIRVTERSDHCGGCQHNCLLKNPGCGVGKDKAARGY